MMATLGFDINDSSVACVVNASGVETVPVNGRDGQSAIGLGMAMTPVGPVFGNAAVCAMQVQPELPATVDLLGSGASSNQWYQDACDKQWRAPEVLQALMTQLAIHARDIAFERHWQGIVAAESECRQKLEQWLNHAGSANEWSIQAIVSRQAALAAHWSSTHPARQTVVTIDWAPRQIHLGIFTCSGGGFKLLHARSLSGAGMLAMERCIAHALLPSTSESITSNSSAQVTGEVATAVGRLWQQALTDASGVGKQHCWIEGELIELVLLQDQLRELLKPTCQRVSEELGRMFDQLGLKPSDIDQVVLSGGPNEVLRGELTSQNLFETETFVVLEDASAVASGAAILSGLAPAKLREIVQADESLSAGPDWKEHTSQRRLDECDVGLRIGNPARGKSVIYRLIEARAQLPAHRSRVFRTSRPQQNRLVLDLVFVSPATGQVVHHETRSLRLPPELPAYSPVEVTVSRDASGEVVLACQPIPVAVSEND